MFSKNNLLLGNNFCYQLHKMLDHFSCQAGITKKEGEKATRKKLYLFEKIYYEAT